MSGLRVRGQGSASTVPYNGPQGSLEADLHVQRVGTLEVDVEFGVSDDEIVDQGEGVLVDGMRSISLWHRKKTTDMFMWTPL